MQINHSAGATTLDPATAAQTALEIRDTEIRGAQQTRAQGESRQNTALHHSTCAAAPPTTDPRDTTLHLPREEGPRECVSATHTVGTTQNQPAAHRGRAAPHRQQ